MSGDTPLTDDRERREALRPDASFLVSAPAGSGKTEVLVRRVLCLLATVDEPEEILAITFTRKAAAEMRQRILGALDRAAAGDDEEEAAEEGSASALARAALARDRERGWRIRERPWRLGLRTIDSFCYWLGQRMPVLSGLGGQVDLVEDARPHYREAVNRLLEELEGEDALVAEDLEQLLTAVNNRWDTAVSFLEECLQRRNRLLLLLSHGTQAEGEEEAFRAQLEESRRRFIGVQLAGAREMLRPYAENLMRLGAAAAERVGASHPIFVLAERAGGLPGDDDIPAWRGVANLLLTGADGWRKRLDKRNGFPPKCQEKEEMLNILHDLEGCDSRPLALLKILPEDPAFGESSWLLLAACRRILKRAAAHLRVVFQERGEMDYAQVALAAQEALQSAPGLAPRLGYSLRHILVDEFQDTSRIQVQLLERLVGDWQTEEGARSLFLVGDAMQSCYRFRDAELELFLEAEQNGIGGLKLEPLQLRSNFRSGKELVEWINERFTKLSEINSRKHGLVHEESDGRFTKLQRGDGGAVRGLASCSPAEARRDFATIKSAELFISPKGQRAAAEAAEAERAVELIQEALDQTSEGHVAILVRNRSHLNCIVRVLRRKKMQWLAQDVDPLAERPAVQDLMMITRALTNPADRLAWLALLRAPWCGLGNRALHEVAVGAKRRTIWQSAICDDLPLEAEDRARLTRLTQTLAPALASYGRVPLRRLVEGVWLALGGSACLEDEQEQEQDALDFLDLLDEFEMGRPLLRERLEAKVQALYASPAAEGTPRLHLMTIHKAKGLEFDTVLLCGLGWRGVSDRSNLLELMPWVSPEGTEEVLAAVSLPGEEDGIADAIRQEEKKKRDWEEQRLVYIAVTRAIRRLHLLGCHEETKKETEKEIKGEAKADVQPAPTSLLGQVWEVMEVDFSTILLSDAEVKEAEDVQEEEFPVAVPSLRRLPCDWQRPPMPAAVLSRAPPPPTPEQQDTGGFQPGEDSAARYQGIVLHEALELMARRSLDVWDDQQRAKAVWRARLRSYGITGPEAAAALETIALGVQNMLQDEQGRQLLASAEAELSLSSLDERGRLLEKRLDCTFLKGEERWVVDYKCSRPRSGEAEKDFLEREAKRYRPQLSGYVQIFQQMEPGRSVRAALYFPLLARQHEVQVE